MQLQPVGGWQVFFPSFPSVHELRPGISAQSEEAPHGSEDKDNFENINKNIVELPSVFGFSKHLLSCETNSSHEQSFVVSFAFRQIFGPSGFVSLQTFLEEKEKQSRFTEQYTEIKVSFSFSKMFNKDTWFSTSILYVQELFLLASLSSCSCVLTSLTSIFILLANILVWYFRTVSIVSTGHYNIIHIYEIHLFNAKYNLQNIIVWYESI